MEPHVEVCVEDAGRQPPPPAPAGGGLSRLSAAALLGALGLAAALLLFAARAQGSAAAEEDFDLRHTLRHISHVRAAIHLHGLHNSSLRSSVQWMSQVDQSHSQGGLRLEDNEIVIPSSGLYFVYSQASFGVPCGGAGAGGDPDDVSMVHISHTVQRWSRTWASERTQDSYHTILHSMRTACQQAGGGRRRDGSWYSAVYMGAVFSLETGDRLRTPMKAELLARLEDDPGKTYFGVFAL